MPQIQYLGPLEAKTPNVRFLGPLDGTAEEELRRIEQLPEGYGSTEPWVDPTTVFGIGAMQGVRTGVKAGVGLGRAAIRGLTSGLTGAVAEYPIGTAAEIVEKETSPMVALPFNIAVGLLSAATVERVIEKRVARALGTKATPQVIAEAARAIKGKVATKDYTDPIISKPIEKEEIVDLTEEVLPIQKVEPTLPQKPEIKYLGELEEAPVLPPKEIPVQPAMAVKKPVIERIGDLEPSEIPSVKEVGGVEARPITELTDKELIEVIRAKPIEKVEVAPAKEKKSIVDIRKEKFLEGKTEGLDNLITEGWKPVAKEFIDDAATKRLESEYNNLRRNAPIGNKNHPDTIKMYELSDKLKKGIKKTVYRLEKDNTAKGISKIEYDYLTREKAVLPSITHPVAKVVTPPPKKAKAQSDTEISLTDFVRKYGGLSTKKEALKGEIRDRLTIKEGYNLVNNKTGRSLDEMVEGSIAGGFLPEGATIRELLDAIDADVAAKKAKTQTGRAWSSFKQDFEVPERPLPVEPQWKDIELNGMDVEEARNKAMDRLGETDEYKEYAEKVNLQGFSVSAREVGRGKAPVEVQSLFDEYMLEETLKIREEIDILDGKKVKALTTALTFGDIGAIAAKKGKVLQEGLFGGPEIVGARPAKPLSTREQPGLFAGEAKATPELPEAPRVEMEAPKEQLPFGELSEPAIKPNRLAVINAELAKLQAQYEMKSGSGGRNGMVPPSIRASALKSITDKMDKLDAEKAALQKEQLPFGVTSGALPSVSKEAGHLVLPEGLSRIGKATKEFFVPLSTLPEGEKYKALRYKSFGDVDRAERFAGKIWDRTKNLTPEVKRDMFRFLDGEVSKESLPANVKPLAQSLQTINNMIGKMLVNKGLLDEATYEAHKGQYIKYLYLKHLLPEDAKLPIGHSGKLDLSYLKGRMDPVVKVSRVGKEYVDKNVYEGILKVAEGLGVTHERRFKAKRGALGYATKGTGETVTQYGTELSVLAHELGHQLDYKYNLWDRIVGEGVSPKGKDVVNKELRALADLTFEGSEVSKYYKAKVRKTAEKMAHMLEAYIHAPTRFKEVAPETYSKFDSFIKSQPETSPLSKILQGLALKEVEVKHYQVVSRGGHAYTSPTLTLKEAKAKLPSVQKQVDNYRKEIGLVEDVSVAEPVGVLKPLTDLSKHKFYSEIAVNPEWTWQPSVVTVDGKKMGIGALAEEVKIARQMHEQAPHVPEIKTRLDRLDTALQSAIAETKNVTGDYVQLPTSKSYGPLAGAYIRKEIARDIQPVFSGFNNQGDLSRTVNTIFQIERKGMAMFKVGKTALNVPTMVRNMGSNVIQLNMSGIPLHDMPGLLVKSASAMKSKDKFYVEGLRNGIFKTNWSEAEIGEVLDTVRTMQKTSVMQMYGQIGKLAKFYGKIDDFFKLAKFIEQREKGVEIAKAAIEAQKWGMDYSLAHPAIKIARQHIAPFVSYQYKIAPLIAETLAKRPWVIAKYAAIPYLMYEAAKQTLSLSDKDFEKLKKDLPLYIQKTGSYAVLPWKSPEGNVQWVNLEYFLPWGNMMAIARDVKEGQPRDLIGDVGIGNPFLDVYSAIKTAKGDAPPKDPFSGREIWNALDSPTDKSLKMAEWLYGKWAPSMLTREGAGGYTLRVGEKDRYGRTISPEQAAGRWVGLNIIAPTTQQGAIEKRAREKALLSSLYRILKDPTITEEKKQRARDEFLKKAREIRGIEGNQDKPDISTLSDDELKSILRRKE